MFSIPTGAGDTFAGGLMGALAEYGAADQMTLRRAMAYGAVVASFGVEAFSLERLQKLNRAEIEERMGAYRQLTHLG